MLTRSKKAAKYRRNSIGITRMSIFLSRIFSSMVGEASIFVSPSSKPMIGALDVASGLGSGTVGPVSR